MGWFGWASTSAKALYYMWKYGSKFMEMEKEHPDWSFPRLIKAVLPDIPKLVAEFIVLQHYYSVLREVSPAFTEQQYNIYFRAREDMERDLKDMKENWDNW
ncbi:hypothetical protein GQ457_18G022660 [Hibiscus cannabinus]